MLIAAGKHYINVGEISHIQYLSVTETYDRLAQYEISTKNGQYLRVSVEEFENFKKNCISERTANVF